MERVQKIVPWSIVNISTVAEGACFVAPGFTFTFKKHKDGTASYTADWSGKKVIYDRGKTNRFLLDVKKFVESEKARRELSSPVTAQLLSTIDRLERKLKKTKEKYEALKYAPGGEKFQEAKASFEQLKSGQ
ncbi:hypothetical protein MEL_013 [Melbournevirus]|uniref:hypothetical protein n=1 Tax=Melbournevirus TaxID=1560514 RepID=UPI00051F5279|nr:hypothetical protein MEL_013 [Melbournevirus]AIT54626.1 hypothetical protein MEL_013 [Melbournevirus]